MKNCISDYIVVMLSQTNNSKLFDNIKGPKNIIRKTFYEDYNYIFKTHTYVIVLISAISLTTLIENIIISIKFRFNHVPIIMLLEEPKIETARKCGELGVNKIISYDEDEKLIIENIKYIIKDQIFIRLVDFNIDIDEYSTIIQNALKIIEDNYIKLIGTKEIADILDVSDCSLIREFNKYKLLTPKRLLLYFKVRHSLVLMLKDGLSLKEISNLSGFSNEKRFIECFHRVFGNSPGIVRKRITLEYINAFSKNITNYEILQDIFQVS